MPSRNATAKAALTGFFASLPEVLEWGVTPAGKPLPNAENLQAWVEERRHAGLGYMEERLVQRKSPLSLFPWAKSAVLFSIRQNAPFGSDTGDFRIAAYALGEDYHHRALRILNAAEKHLSEIAEVNGHPSPRFAGFCDTWPVFERDLAAEAGLGWRGKNACLIHRRHGSGFLLAGFFTDLNLESNVIPQQSFCGGCTACLDHCPTGALFEPGRLDASKCLGYWTIEAKGDIPAEISEKSGTWIFGCDLCQEACPWNRKLQKTTAPEFPVGPPRTAREWLSLLRKGGGFANRFNNTPLLRAGRRALLRNALIALRHLKAEDVNDLLNSLASKEDDPVVRAELHKTMHP